MESAEPSPPKQRKVGTTESDFSSQMRKTMTTDFLDKVQSKMITRKRATDMDVWKHLIHPGLPRAHAQTYQEFWEMLKELGFLAERVDLAEKNYAKVTETLGTPERWILNRHAVDIARAIILPIITGPIIRECNDHGSSGQPRDGTEASCAGQDRQWREDGHETQQGRGREHDQPQQGAGRDGHDGTEGSSGGDQNEDDKPGDAPGVSEEGDAEEEKEDDKGGIRWKYPREGLEYGQRFLLEMETQFQTSTDFLDFQGTVRQLTVDELKYIPPGTSTRVLGSDEIWEMKTTLNNCTVYHGLSSRDYVRLYQHRRWSAALSMGTGDLYREPGVYFAAQPVMALWWAYTSESSGSSCEVKNLTGIVIATMIAAGTTLGWARTADDHKYNDFLRANCAIYRNKKTPPPPAGILVGTFPFEERENWADQGLADRTVIDQWLQVAALEGDGVDLINANVSQVNLIGVSGDASGEGSK